MNLRALARTSARLFQRTMSTQPPKLAIIDDYLSTSTPHFAHIPPSTLSISTFTNTLTGAPLVDRLRPFTAISNIRERTPLPASLLRQLPNLKLLLATGTQFETFDLGVAKELGITVVAAPGLGRTDTGTAAVQRPNIKVGGAHPTTQHTWALILALARNVAVDDAMIKSGLGWQSGLATGLTGLTLGIVGLGRLGAAVARIGHLAWGMRVICWSANLTQQKADQMAVDVGLPAGTFEVVNKDEMFRAADVVSLHYVLSQRSRGIVGAAELGAMKPSALLVNASRGPLIDDAALLDTLESGHIRGAAMDVFEQEPLPADSPWRRSGYWGRDGRSNVLTTPHMGYVDEGLMNAWYAETAENVERWLDGREVLHRLV
ncbi:D-isomer specific 2-hydroxyacid dehydrogenase [Roridomyces roridus]|uniref:D-isomer specific 2-hydroxyacid dehydrogenase n=1 Tax=Roridomyces roridus TaxID=1738132 RepID=A0AAD7FCS3_9AGAR|nr:D-isomer specific 2-hydroxyacid dehydrogenase [Roridomyces roridus]